MAGVILVIRKKVKYIGFYDIPNSKCNRVSNLAATNKMNYIASAISRAGHDVEIVSPSWMKDNCQKKFEKQKTIKLDDNICVTFCPSWKTTNKLTRNIKIVFTLIWLFVYLLLNVERNEKILAYHVQWISLPVRVAKLIKRFELILEVEEVYSEVWSESQKFKKLEKKLIDCADSYIFVSDVLKERLNRRNKDYIILYGGYNVIELSEDQKMQSNLIKLIYAGSIDTTKGGAYKALDAIKYLPDNYRLHILGHGSEDHIVRLKNKINEINKQRSKEICIYDGTLYGLEYSEYLSQCDIALNSQNQGDYMSTAFPSKILSYLAHNLRVVSTKIESIERSTISDYIYFSEDDNPKSIADAVMSIDVSSNYDSKELIKKLDVEFIAKIKNLIEG